MPRLLTARPAPGVNLVGYFEAAKGALSFAPGIRDALRVAGVPHVAVPLDHDLPEVMTGDRIRYEEGAPFPVTVLAIPPDEWARALLRMPLGSRAGGRVIGYVNDASVSLSREQTALVDELWAPTEELARAVSEISFVPVRVVPPAVDPPPEFDRDHAPDLNPERFWFLAVDGGRGDEDDRAVSAAIECMRRLVRDGASRAGLCLAVGPEKRELEQQLAHLPIHVIAEPLRVDALDGLLSACGGYLDLHPAQRIDPVLVKAMMRGMPVVVGWREALGSTGHSNDDHGTDRPSPIEVGTTAIRFLVTGGNESERAGESVKLNGDPFEVSTAAEKWAAEVDRVLGSDDGR